MLLLSSGCGADGSFCRGDGDAVMDNPFFIEKHSES